jgi:hypothetical protein
MTTTETTAQPAAAATAAADGAATKDTTPARRRTRTTVTLGPFLVALTENDRREGRPTVVVALAYVAPDDAQRSSAAARLIQLRLGQALRAVPLTDLRSVAESLFDALAEPRWVLERDKAVEHGIRVSQVAVSLLPRDLSSGTVRPMATVSVADPELALPGAA